MFRFIVMQRTLHGQSLMLFCVYVVQATLWYRRTSCIAPGTSHPPEGATSHCMAILHLQAGTTASQHKMEDLM
jgi:hypothetical protein